MFVDKITPAALQKTKTNFLCVSNMCKKDFQTFVLGKISSRTSLELGFDDFEDKIIFNSSETTRNFRSQFGKFAEKLETSTQKW